MKTKIKIIISFVAVLLSTQSFASEQLALSFLKNPNGVWVYVSQGSTPIQGAEVKMQDILGARTFLTDNGGRAFIPRAHRNGVKVNVTITSGSGDILTKSVYLPYNPRSKS